MVVVGSTKVVVVAVAMIYVAMGSKGNFTWSDSDQLMSGKGVSAREKLG